MTKRERVLAALARRPVDRPPVAFWRHVPEVDHSARGLAAAMLAFHRRWDLDLIKVMSSGVYCVEDWGCKVAYQGAPNGAKACVEHAVKTPADWGRLRSLDPEAGALGRELDAVRLIAEGREDDAPVLHTVFAPLTIARKLAGDALVRHMTEAVAAVRAGLEVIAETTARHALAALAAGADGLFFATQTASRKAGTREAHARLDVPLSRRILAAVAGRSTVTLLHLHGRDLFFDLAVSLPVHALNWHDRLTAPSLAEAQRQFPGAVVGGLAEWQTLRAGSPAAVAAECADAVRQTGGIGLVVAPGCVLPLDVPDASLAAVVDAVKSSRA